MKCYFLQTNKPYGFRETINDKETARLKADALTRERSAEIERLNERVKDMQAKYEKAHSEANSYKISYVTIKIELSEYANHSYIFDQKTLEK